MKKWILLTLAFFGCRKVDENGFKTYIIKKNRHRSGIQVKRDYRDKIEFEVIFNESAIYTSKDSVNQLDINKLAGGS